MQTFIKKKSTACRRAVAYIIGFMLLCGLAGCSCSKRSEKEELTGGPGTAVARVIMLANQGRYDEAALLVEFRKVASLDADFNDADGGGWSEERKRLFWDEITMNRSVTKVQVLSEKVRDDFAMVKVKVINPSGDERLKSFDLEKKAKAGWIVIVYYKMIR